MEGESFEALRLFAFSDPCFPAGKATPFFVQKSVTRKSIMLDMLRFSLLEIDFSADLMSGDIRRLSVSVFTAERYPVYRKCVGKRLLS
jgi:hypothetical protein